MGPVWSSTSPATKVKVWPAATSNSDTTTPLSFTPTGHPSGRVRPRARPASDVKRTPDSVSAMRWPALA